MKNRIFCLILTLIGTLCAYAQTTILGIPVGETYTNAEMSLIQRYGFKCSSENGKLKLYDFEMGGLPFQYGELDFQWIGATGRLSSAMFQDWVSLKQLSKIKEKRDFLRKVMADKYLIVDKTNDQGFDIFFFYGEKENGVEMMGCVDLSKFPGNDGTNRYYLTLYYFPKADFIQQGSDF